jgi:hypothetical protein
MQENTENKETQQEVDPLDNPMINEVARKFNITIADITNYAKNMKAGPLARVFIAAMEFPFNRSMPKFKNKAEEELFLMCVATQYFKSIMSAAIAKHEGLVKKIEEEAASSFADELIKNAKGGKNG